jgi:hypothetical protein
MILYIKWTVHKVDINSLDDEMIKINYKSNNNRNCTRRRRMNFNQKRHVPHGLQKQTA